LYNSQQKGEIMANKTKAKPGSVEAMIEIATKEVGTIEGPKDNETKYGAWIKVNFQPWCQSFVSWCAFTSGLDIKDYPKTASTVEASKWFRQNSRWGDARNDDPTPGDWIYFDFPDDGVNRISHVGLCVKNNGDGTIQVIEGNTSGTAKGDQRNGGMCVEKTRGYEKNNKKKLINAVIGWGRPQYKGEENIPLLSKLSSTNSDTTKDNDSKVTSKKPFSPFGLKATGKEIKQIQKKMLIASDGVFGASTEEAVKKFQKANRLPETGIVDYQTWLKIMGKN
jgi:hypothetical protein